MKDIDYEALEKLEGEDCSGDCSSCSSDCGKANLTARHAKVIIAVTSGKGGTGKSVICALLANALAAKGLKTAIIDADVAGPTIHLLYELEGFADSDEKQIFPMTTANGISVLSMGNVYDKPQSPILWEGKQLAGGAEFFYTEAKWDNIDVMLIDMPTGIGSIPLNLYTTIPFDGAVMVATPDALCDYTAIKTVNLLRMLMISPLGVVENKTAIACYKCGQSFTLGSDPVDHAKAMGLELAAALPYDVSLSILAESGRITDAEAPQLNGLADSIEALVKQAK